MKDQMILVKKDHVLVARFSGDIDNITSLKYRTTLIEAIEKEKFKQVIINLKDVSFIDSSGIGLILGRYNQVNAYGGKLIVCELNDSCKKIFEITGMFKIIDNYLLESEALTKAGVK